MALHYRAAKPGRQEGILQASFVNMTASGFHSWHDRAVRGLGVSLKKATLLKMSIQAASVSKVAMRLTVSCHSDADIQSRLARRL